MTSTVRSAAVRLTMENAQYLRATNQSATATEAATGRIQRSVRRTAVSTGRDWDAVGKYGGRAAVGAAAALAVVVKTTADFGSEMALVRTLSHANTTEMDKLSRAALTVGRDIGYSATSVAQGEEEMIKAGISVKDILGGGLKGALDLAAAGQTDVATATSIAASALTEFRLKGKDVPHIADLLAAGADKALGSVEDLGYGLEQSGTTAHQMGLSIEQTVGTLAAFAQAGLTGERGGTTFKQMLLQLAAPTSVAQKLMDKYHISLYNANGQIKTMPQLAGNLQRSLGGLDPKARNAALGIIFGSRAIQGANILMADGRVEIAKWIRKVDDQGFAAGQASGKLDSLSGDVKKFKSTLDTTFIQAGSPSQHALRGLVQDADHLVRDFSNLPGEVQQGVLKVLALTAAVGGTLWTISKIRNVARELGGGGVRRGRGAGGLGGAASFAAPVPVFVVNMGAGGLGGAGGKGGGLLLAGGAEGKGATLFGKAFRLPRGTGVVATAAGLALMLTGTTDKTHTGSTVGGSLAGGQIFGAPGALIGGSLGALHDVYNSGNAADDALERAKKALASGDLKEQKAALAGLRTEAEKLGNGGWGQNFARGVTELTGRRQDIEDTGKALEDAVNPKIHKETVASLRYLLSGGKEGHLARPPKPPKPEKDALETLLNPKRKGVEHPKQLTSEEVLAQIYGINPKRLKPVNLLDEITGFTDSVFGGKGKGPSKKAAAKAFAVSLGMDTSEFDRKWKRAHRNAADLDALTVNPKVNIDTAQAMSATTALRRLLDSLHDRNIHVNVTKSTNANLAEASVVHPAGGGLIRGPGTGTSDSIPAYVSNGEYVMRAAAVAKYGTAMFDRYNSMRFAAGGPVGGPTSQAFITGTGVTVLFPAPSVLAAAVKAADDFAAAEARAAMSARDIRQENLDLLHTQQQIRDLTKQLHERNKKHRLELRGLDRKVAQAELADLQASLKEIRDETRRAAAEALAEKRTEATQSLSQAGDIFGRGTSPTSAISSVNRAIADISTYGQVMAQLKTAGASPALLQQLINRAQQGDFRSAIRLGKALLAQPGTLSQLNASLATLGAVSSSVATLTTDGRFLSSAAWNPTSTKVVQVNVAADPTLWMTELKRVITFEVSAALQGATG